MHRKFAVISIDELKEKILEAYNKQALLEGAATVTLSALTKLGPEYLRSFFSEITPIVYADLSEVEFDWENFIYTEVGKASKHLGFHTLPNGLTFFMAYAGGDWEIPVNFIIYFDGSELRGYIPSAGNPYNRTTKQAYGNNEDADDIDMLEQYPDAIEEPRWDFDLMVKDIVNTFRAV